MNIRLLGLVAVLLAAHTWAANAESQNSAEIISLQGKGEFRATAEPRWHDASVHQQLVQGDYVRTGDTSRMAVLLSDQTQVRLAANSMIQIKQVGDAGDRGDRIKQSAGRSWTQAFGQSAPDKQQGDKRGRDTIIKQSSGRSWMQSKNIPNQLSVETPSALAAIRGTDWEMVVDEDGTSTLTVLSGEVQLSNEKGSVSVGVGEQAQAKIGVAPVKRILRNPRDRIQWVSSFKIDLKRYPEIDGIRNAAPGSEQAALQAIGVLLRAGDLSAARRTVENLVARQPATGTAHLLLADYQVLDGEIEQAIATLREGAKRYPDDERFDVWRARLHLIRDEIDEARAAIAAARARNPHSSEAMIAEGELERFEGHAGAATAAYRSALATAPESARAWHGLGVVQTEREDVKNARTSLNRAISLDPQGTGFRGELGTLEAFADNLAAARAAFSQAIEEHPDDYVALTGLGLVELKSGNTLDAITHLLGATLIEPRYARAQTYLAVAYYQQGRTRDALFALSRARDLDPKDPLPDLLESVINNDRLRPGDALVTARRALTLLPYLKSLNQVANDQKGGANLGSALAAFKMEDWARSYAQDSYYPFWAGSHLFLADRYSGAFNKKSELFQGYLSDPTVFGASNRYSTLIQRPGDYLNINTIYNNLSDYKMSETTVTANGYANSAMPFAYFAEAIRTDARPGLMAFGGSSNNYTLALGARPTHELGLFAYANAIDTNFAQGTASTNGFNNRIDMGANYRFSPQSQAWLKIGTGNESSTSTTPTITNVSNFTTKPNQSDIQFRHTFAANERNEVSWGAEYGKLDKTNTYIEYLPIRPGFGLSNILNEHDQDHSNDIWLSDRFHASERLNLQGDLAYQHYTKAREINQSNSYNNYYEFVPPLTKSSPENYDRSFFAPRFGATYVFGNGATLRGAYQKWQCPASYNSLAPVSTAGIPVDDSLVYPGGTLSRTRGQLDWELSSAWFMSAFADHRNVDNLNSPLDGVQNTRPDLANLDRLQQHSILNLAAPDLLETKPIFSSGKATSGGVTVDHVLSRNLAGYFGYVNTHSSNTGATYSGNQIPYLPNHRATLGLAWYGEQHMTVSAQTIWRSQRFTDEANLSPLAASWDMTLQVHWESADKRWDVVGYAQNLLRKNTSDQVGVNLTARF